MVAHLDSQRSIRRLVAAVESGYDRLNVLVNNAGAVFGKRELTDDGFERTFATNHLGLFALTLLMPLPRRPSSARVVPVASRVHANRIDFDKLRGERSHSPGAAYARG